jgi:hypothetical protein
MIPESGVGPDPPATNSGRPKSKLRKTKTPLLHNSAATRYILGFFSPVYPVWLPDGDYATKVKIF